MVVRNWKGEYNGTKTKGCKEGSLSPLVKNWETTLPQKSKEIKVNRNKEEDMARRRKAASKKPKWGKIGAPKSAKRKAWMKKIAKKR